MAHPRGEYQEGSADTGTRAAARFRGGPPRPSCRGPVHPSSRRWRATERGMKVEESTDTAWYCPHRSSTGNLPQRVVPLGVAFLDELANSCWPPAGGGAVFFLVGFGDNHSLHFTGSHEALSVASVVTVAALDRPDLFDPTATDGHTLPVQVHRGTAVRRQNLDPFAKGGCPPKNNVAAWHDLTLPDTYAAAGGLSHRHCAELFGACHLFQPQKQRCHLSFMVKKRGDT